MSLEARLKHGFERATRAAPSVTDAALASIVATYHRQRRQRAVLLAATAAAAVLALVAGDGAVRWVQGLERDIPPADESRDLDNERSGGERSGYESLDEPTRRSVPDGVNVAVPGFGISGGSTRARFDDGPSGGIASIIGSGSDGAVVGGDYEDGTDSRSSWRFTRRERAKWSHSPEPGNSPTTTFIVRRDESKIRVGVVPKGGGGFDSSGVPAEVYEIVDGERRLLAIFCGDSYLLEVTPGATIEVRALVAGCGSAVYVKGIAIVRFYR